MNPGDEASASEYETTRGSWKSIHNLLLQLPSAMPKSNKKAFNRAARAARSKEPFYTVTTDYGLQTTD